MVSVLYFFDLKMFFFSETSCEAPNLLDSVLFYSFQEHQLLSVIILPWEIFNLPHFNTSQKCKKKHAFIPLSQTLITLVGDSM